MTLDEQIKYAERLLNDYEIDEGNSSDPEIIKWLKSLIESLHRLKDLER